MHGTCTSCKADGPLVLLERGGMVRALCPACAGKVGPPEPLCRAGCQALVLAVAAAGLVGFAVGWIARGG
jgi:hypothetical protein